MAGPQVASSKAVSREVRYPGLGTVLQLPIVSSTVVFPPASISTSEAANVWRKQLERFFREESKGSKYCFLSLREAEKPDNGIRDCIALAETVANACKITLILSDLSGPMRYLLRQKEAKHRVAATWSDGVIELSRGTVPPIRDLRSLAD